MSYPRSAALFPRLASALALAALLGAPARAADLSGTWTWTVRTDGQEITREGRFRQEGEKLTGKVRGKDVPAVEIQEGTVKDGQISFRMVRDLNGQELRLHYRGKLEGETIRGTIAASVGGQEASLEWEAKRVKPADLTGNWTWTVVINGNERRSTAEFKSEGEKLTGTIAGQGGQKVEIREGSISGVEVSFHVIRVRNGQELKIRYTGRLEGEILRGKIVVTVDGQDRELDWEAKRVKE